MRPSSCALLIPAVENSVDGRSYPAERRPPIAQGLTVEIGNTDAEGRLVLADALAEADRDEPALLIDLATLTGAARVALGPELPAVYSNRRSSRCSCDRSASRRPIRLADAAVGRLRRGARSRVADLDNVVDPRRSPGSIVAALFLKRFVTRTRNWLHVDLYAWNREGAAGPSGRRRSARRARGLPPDPAALWLKDRADAPPARYWAPRPHSAAKSRPGHCSASRSAWSKARPPPCSSRRLRGRGRSPWIVNLAVAFVSGAPALSNVVSFVWANLAHGRARIGLMVGLQATFAILVGLVRRRAARAGGLAFAVASDPHRARRVDGNPHRARRGVERELSAPVARRATPAASSS